MVNSSSLSAMRSTIVARAATALAMNSAGISSIVGLAPRSSPKTRAFMMKRSITPLKVSSRPNGNWIGTGVTPRRSMIIWQVRSKLAPMRSILLTKQIRGTL